MKTCFFCKGTVAHRPVDYMAQQQGNFLLLRSLRAEVCQQCGEIYLDADASRQIDTAFAHKETAEQHLNVPVFISQ